MKNILFTLSAVAFLLSCSSTSTNKNAAPSNVPQGNFNVANSVAEINNLLTTLNLSPSQSLQVSSSISDYVAKFNSLGDLPPDSNEYKTKLKKYKSSTLSSISTALSSNQYNNFINSLIYATNSSNSFLSTGTINVLSSLVN